MLIQPRNKEYFTGRYFAKFPLPNTFVQGIVFKYSVLSRNYSDGTIVPNIEYDNNTKVIQTTTETTMRKDCYVLCQDNTIWKINTIDETYQNQFQAKLNKKPRTIYTLNLIKCENPMEVEV